MRSAVFAQLKIDHKLQNKSQYFKASESRSHRETALQNKSQMETHRTISKITPKPNSSFQTVKTNDVLHSWYNPKVTKAIHKQAEKRLIQEKKTAIKNPLENVSKKMASYFKTVDIESLTEEEIDERLYKEFFKKDICSTARSKRPREMIENSASFEVVELNNKSIHFSNIVSQSQMSSPQSAKTQCRNSPIHIHHENSPCEATDCENFADEIRNFKGKIALSDLHTEAKASCMFHLGRIEHLLQRPDSQRIYKSFGQLMPPTSRFTKKRTPLQHFKFI